jgi:hypothetical protein
MPLESIPHREVQQAAFFRLVDDDVEIDAGATPDAIEDTSPFRASRTALVAAALIRLTPCNSIEVRNPSTAAITASPVRDLIAPPDENESRPSDTRRESSSTIRGGCPTTISATASRMALAPMSRTATRTGTSAAAASPADGLSALDIQPMILDRRVGYRKCKRPVTAGE